MAVKYPMAVRGAFKLYVLDSGVAGWTNLKLVRVGKAPKNNWWLGWNGERLARNRDCALLDEHYPEVEQWVIETLSGMGSVKRSRA